MRASVSGRQLYRKVPNACFLRISKTWNSTIPKEAQEPRVKSTSAYSDDKHVLNKNHDQDPQAETKLKATK